MNITFMNDRREKMSGWRQRRMLCALLTVLRITSGNRGRCWIFIAPTGRDPDMEQEIVLRHCHNGGGSTIFITVSRRSVRLTAIKIGSVLVSRTLPNHENVTPAQLQRNARAPSPILPTAPVFENGFSSAYENNTGSPQHHALVFYRLDRFKRLTTARDMPPAYLVRELASLMLSSFAPAISGPSGWR